MDSHQVGFVDDYRNDFDALAFAETVKAGVGEGRITSSVALRDPKAVAAASAALHHFHKLATDDGDQDVVAAYVMYSPGAAEIFTALRAISVERALALVALDCLTSIVRYALSSPRPPQPLEAARSVVKEIVKTRAVLIYDIFVHDSKSCAKKALNLLRLVATCHPILAKEIVNRFDIGSKHMAPALCSAQNDFCRVPFLDLMFTLFTSGDHDVVWHLSARSREALIACLSTIARRATSESELGRTNYLKSAEKGKAKGKNATKLTPSHLLRRELIAAINFILALERHVLVGPTDKIRRTAFANPVLKMLATIAATEIPPFHISPREVLEQQEALRASAAHLFIAIAKDSRISNVSQIAGTLNSISVTENTAAVKFVLHVIEEQPRICRRLLESGPYLSSTPRLSSAWFGYASVTSACILRLTSVTSIFSERCYLEKCLSHSKALVRHFGALMTLAVCKVVEEDASAALEAQKYLPPLETVQLAVKKAGPGDELALNVLAAYQTLFRKDIVEKNTVVIKVSMAAIENDMSSVEHSVRAALRTNPKESLRVLLHQNYLCEMIVRAVRTRNEDTSRKLWGLCRHVICSTKLFPYGTDSEIDVYLAHLSSLETSLDKCAQAFVHFVALAWDMPYGLYDDLHETCEGDRSRRTSLFSVSAVRRLRKLHLMHGDSKLPESDRSIAQLLKVSLTTLVGCNNLLHGSSAESFLTVRLLDILRPEEVWWTCSRNDVGYQSTVIVDCQKVQRMFLAPHKYPMTPYLELLRSVSALRLWVEHRQSHITFGDQTLVKVSFAWKSWCSLRKTAQRGGVHDGFFNSFIADSIFTGAQESFGGMSLGLLLQRYGEPRAQDEVRQEIAKLKASLNVDKFAVTIGMVLRVSTCGSAVTESVQAVAQLFADSDEGGVLSEDVVDFLHESLLSAVRAKDNWDKDQIQLLVALAVQRLAICGPSEGSEKGGRYWVALLNSLINHRDNGTSAWSLNLFSKEEIKDIPSLSTFDLKGATEVSSISRCSPTLQRLCIREVANFTDIKASQPLPRLFPLICAALGSDLPAQVKTELRGTDRGICLWLLEAACTIKDSWLGPGSAEENHQVLENVNTIGGQMFPDILGFQEMSSMIHSYNGRLEDLSLNVWILLHGAIYGEQEETKADSVSDKSLVELVSVMSDWFAITQISLEAGAHVCALRVFLWVQRTLHSRKLAIYSVCRDASVLEKSLISLCSNIMKSLHKVLGCCDQDSPNDGAYREAGKTLMTESLNTALSCIVEVLRFDLVLDKAAKRTLISTGAHGGTLVTSCMQKCLKNELFGMSSVPGSLRQSFADMIRMAVTRLPRFSLEKEVAQSLGWIDRIMTTEVFGFNASCCDADLSIRKCLSDVQVCLKVNDARERFQLQNERAGYFQEVAAEVLPMFDKSRLDECCCTILLRTESTQVSSSLDPSFVLGIFLRACGEALQAPESPVLDIGRIAKEGLLSLALTGLASPQESLRALSYACLDAFSRVVGPLTGVPMGSAASLYKDRRQLAFLLTLIRQSIPESLFQVLPLFAVWFRTALKVALTPTHAAYNAVTYFFLRAPVLDVSDCVGIVHMFRCDAFGAELKACRLLGLQIVQAGIHSRQDAAIVRKRRIIDILFMLAGSACGFDTTVKIESLKALAAILERDSKVGLTQDLLLSHGIIPWLVAGASHKDEFDSTFQPSVDVLLKLSKSCATGVQQSRFAPVLSRALSVLVRSHLSAGNALGQAHLLELIVETGQAICRLSPHDRRLISLNVAELCGSSLFSDGEDSALFRRRLLQVVLQQSDSKVDPRICLYLLEDAISECKVAELNVMKSTDSSAIQMSHAFVADALEHLRNELQPGKPIFKQLCHAVARSLQSCPTVWTALAGFFLLDCGDGKLPRKLAKYAENLPASPPRILDPTVVENTFKRVVSKTRALLVEHLLERASL